MNIPVENQKISVVSNIFKANDHIANENRKLLNDSGVFAINIMGSPGSGKTSFLESLMPKLLNNGLKAGVIFGDIATTKDAERLQKFGIPVVQIMTEAFGGACHLDASMIKEGLNKIQLKDLDLLFIENVGNLVCPAIFDIGEHARIVVLSVTEGEDKPSKYPTIFLRTDLVILNKVDLIPYLSIKTNDLLKEIRKINQKLDVIEFSNKEVNKTKVWLDWFEYIRKLKKFI
ncbi:hydrogenase nickel incorporation protein HypB [bacterium]|nr:hydrogenase nickel incorporation protein HypB [bacterium]